MLGHRQHQRTRDGDKNSLLNRVVAGPMAVAIGALAIALGASACVPPPVTLAEGPREYVASDYDNVLKRWTREESLILYTELERALTVTATFESWDFRWAYVIRYAQDYRLTIPERQRLLSKKLNESREHHQFFVALYGSKRKFNDLTKADSAWIVRLIDETGNETAPSQIERIRRPNILEQRYYPYNSVWRTAFRIRFPVKSGGRKTVSDEAAWIGLRFAGAWGNTDLIWETEEAGTKAVSTEAAQKTEASAPIRTVRLAP